MAENRVTEALAPSAAFLNLKLHGVSLPDRGKPLVDVARHRRDFQCSPHKSGAPMTRFTILLGQRFRLIQRDQANHLKDSDVETVRH